MKKLIFLSFAVVILSTSEIFSQGLHLGIKAGTNISQVTGRSFDDGFQWGFCAGAFAELNVGSKWGLQPELLFSQSKTQTASNFNDIYNDGIPGRNFTLNYLTIPVLLSYKLPLPILSLQFGPQFGILMNTSENITTNGKNAFKSNNFSLVGGVQVNLLKVNAGVRYIYGLTNIDDITDVDTWKNQNFQVYFGLRIF